VTEIGQPVSLLAEAYWEVEGGRYHTGAAGVIKRHGNPDRAIQGVEDWQAKYEELGMARSRSGSTERLKQ